MNNRHMVVTADHMVDGLGVGLYENVGQRVLELMRNGLAASMPPGVWTPNGVKIELMLIPHHPLSPKNGPALIVLDHGSGLTDPMVERYFYWLGTPIRELREREKGIQNGVSQKGIGRLAALALNENCLHEDRLVRIRNGYYLFSRTAASGEIRFVPVIPEKAEMNGGFETERFISPTSTEMGPLKDIKGSFTAIVVPSPVFKTADEIYEAIKWLLPREQDKMFDLTINGKPVGPPPLEKTLTLTSKDGRYRARLGAGNDKSEGIWLCDEENGFRVASCNKLGKSILPDPLWFPELSGDIFAPKLLAHQNTARSSLNKEYTRQSNKEWSKLKMWLITEVAPAARKLIERDSISGDAAQALDEVVEMFKGRFGEPDDMEEQPLPRKGSGGERRRPDPDAPKAEPAPYTKPQYRRYVSIKVGEETYILYRGQSLEAHTFARVSDNNPNQVIVNVRGAYCALPKGKEARREHVLMQILFAIGSHKFERSPYRATIFANQMRAEFLKK
ncbi:MAG: hypothetical protein JWN50_475 [Parcubacteria group bacterium]|nr:hypothetical protein [Parcubacteria group bacterium]